MLHFHANWTVCEAAKPERVFPTEMEARGYLASQLTSLANYLLTDELPWGDEYVVDHISDCLRLATAIMTGNEREWMDSDADSYRFHGCDEPSCPHQPLESRFGTFIAGVTPEDFNY